MRRAALSTLALLALAVFAFARSAFAETGDGLEGSVWKYRPKGIIHWFFFWNRDYLVFQSGNFMKASLKDDGYSPSLYVATKTGEGIKWSSTLSSAKSGDISWNGLRVSYWMTGTYKNGDTTRRWKAWQVFPKPSKQDAAPTAPTGASPPQPAAPTK